MEIDQETWKWFSWLGFDNSILMNQSDSTLEYVLSIPFSDMIIRGPAFKDILQKIAIKKGALADQGEKLENIVDAETEEDREINADTIVDFLRFMDLDLGDEIRQLMVNQDIDTYRDLIIDLSKALGPTMDPTISVQNMSDIDQLDKEGLDLGLGEREINFEENYPKNKPRKNPEGKAHVGKIDLMNLNEDKDLLHCTSIPEILVITISRSFKISTIEVNFKRFLLKKF